MFIPVYTKQFEKDIKRVRRRGKNLEKFKIVVRTLLSGQLLDLIHHDHHLKGDYAGRRECQRRFDGRSIRRRRLRGQAGMPH